MNYNKYPLSSNGQGTFFKFTSVGSKSIHKGISFDVTKNEAIYNLGFGDLLFDAETGKYFIDDEAVSDNGDRDVILATVAESVYIYTSKYPDRVIFFKGSTIARTRLYRRAIALNYKELSEIFHIFGALRDENGAVINVDFKPDGNFYGFIIKRK